MRARSGAGMVLAASSASLVVLLIVLATLSPLGHATSTSTDAMVTVRRVRLGEEVSGHVTRGEYLFFEFDVDVGGGGSGSDGGDGSYVDDEIEQAAVLMTHTGDLDASGLGNGGGGGPGGNGDNEAMGGPQNSVSGAVKVFLDTCQGNADLYVLARDAVGGAYGGGGGGGGGGGVEAPSSGQRGKNDRRSVGEGEMPSSVRHDWSSINRGGAVDVVFVPAPRAASLAVAVYGSSNASFVLSVMPFVQEPLHAGAAGSVTFRSLPSISRKSTTVAFAPATVGVYFKDPLIEYQVYGLEIDAISAIDFDPLWTESAVGVPNPKSVCALRTYASVVGGSHRVHSSDDDVTGSASTSEAATVITAELPVVPGRLYLVNVVASRPGMPPISYRPRLLDAARYAVVDANTQYTRGGQENRTHAYYAVTVPRSAWAVVSVTPDEGDPDLFVTLNRGLPTFDDYDYASTTPHPTDYVRINDVEGTIAFDVWCDAVCSYSFAVTHASHAEAGYETLPFVPEYGPRRHEPRARRTASTDITGILIAVKDWMVFFGYWAIQILLFVVEILA